MFACYYGIVFLKYMPPVQAQPCSMLVRTLGSKAMCRTNGFVPTLVGSYAVLEGLNVDSYGTNAAASSDT
jgi:hypothetical protein